MTRWDPLIRIPLPPHTSLYLWGPSRAPELFPGENAREVVQRRGPTRLEGRFPLPISLFEILVDHFGARTSSHEIHDL